MQQLEGLLKGAALTLDDTTLDRIDEIMPPDDIGPPLSGTDGVGREPVGERDDEVAQFIWAFDDKRPVE